MVAFEHLTSIDVNRMNRILQFNTLETMSIDSTNLSPLHAPLWDPLRMGLASNHSALPSGFRFQIAETSLPGSGREFRLESGQ